MTILWENHKVKIRLVHIFYLKNRDRISDKIAIAAGKNRE